MRWLPLLFLLVAAAANAEEEASYCPFGNSTSECHCEEYDGGYDLWCPTRYNHDYRFNFKSGVLWITCNPENLLTGDDLIQRAKGVKLSNVESLKLEHCPVLGKSYKAVVDELVSSSEPGDGVKRLFLEYGRYNSIEFGEIINDQFAGLDSLERLDIRSMDVDKTGLEENAFRGLPNLKMLKLTGNNVADLPERLFWPLPNLTTLIIQERDVRELKEHLFAKQFDLKHLEVQVSSVKDFPPGIFANLVNLEAIDIRDMRFTGPTSIPKGLLDRNVKLVNATVAGSGLELADETLFAKTKLEHFKWSLYRCYTSGDCNLDIKPFFKGVKTLKSFSFENAFKAKVSLAEDIFDGCEKLESFRVYRTNLSSLPKSVFASTRKLKGISVTQAGMGTPEDGTFDGLNKLLRLDLSRNLMASISSGLLNGLTELVAFDASKNAIESVGKKAFSSLVKLEEMNLAENRIYFDNDDQPRWDFLTAIKMLNLSNNNITISTIPGPWTGTLVSLRKLLLSNNRIGPVIDAVDLKFIQNTILVDLSNNDIQALDFTRAKRLHAFGPRDPQLDVPVVIRLNENPLACDCKAVDFAMFLRKELKEDFITTWFEVEGANEVTCHSPTELKTHAVTSVPYGHFWCPFPAHSSVRDEICPQYCVCRYSPFDAMTSVNCAENGYDTLPYNIPIISGTNHTSVNMTGNNISSLKDLRKRVRNYSSIAELYLDRNRLQTVSVEDLPPNLKRLSISMNEIASFSAATIDFFGSLSWLKMGHNVFPCNCDSRVLVEFVHKFDDRIADVDNITLNCDGKLVKVIDIKVEDICTDIEGFIVNYILPFIILVVVVLVAIIFYLHHKRTLYIWIYSKPWLRDCCFPVPPPDDMIYDVFVSYSSDDREFVEDHLVHQLEHGQDINYKCLMAIRDFNPGENIIKQISEAVKTSRRTAVILSKNFVKSTWYEQEFSAAYQEKRVIVIVLGEVPTKDEMGPLMWDYIKTNTYLPADDPWFWDKLRYALPHKGRRNIFSKKRRTTDKIQLLPQSTLPSPTPSPTDLNTIETGEGTTTAVANNGGAGGTANPAFATSDPRYNAYVAHSAPSSATSNGHTMSIVET